MKKTLCLLLCLALCMGICGCTETTSVHNTTVNVYNQETEVTQEPAENQAEVLLMSDDEIEEYVTYFVRPLYNSINESADYYEKETSGGVSVWKSGDTVMKKEIAAGTDDFDKARQYYFDPESGALMFAFIFKGTEEHRLYFKSGKLVRYIGTSGDVINNPVDNVSASFAARALSEAY